MTRLLYLDLNSEAEERGHWCSDALQLHSSNEVMLELDEETHGKTDEKARTFGFEQPNAF